jgi:DivIVA domain-containing protein
MPTIDFTADVARTTKFREKMRGYHQPEVDAFVAQAAAALEQLQAELASVRARAEQAEAALAHNADNDEMIRRTLTLAEKTAELAVTEANDDSARIRATAQAEVDRLKTETEDECRQRLTAAEEERQAARREAATIVEEAGQQADKLRRSAEEAIVARAEAAQAELEEVLSDLADQRTTLQAHVEALTEYLADERVRVLDALNESTETLRRNLAPAEPPSLVLAAMAAEPPELASVVERVAESARAAEPETAEEHPWASAEPASTTWSAEAAAEEDPGAAAPEGDVAPDGANPEDAAADQAVPTELEAPPALLFSFNGDRRPAHDERRRPHGDRSGAVAVDAKPRRASKARRPS